MDFEQAVENMDPMQVNDYLQKILYFLKRDEHELYFPNISPYVETFLMHLVSDTRNLESIYFSNGSMRFASEIIHVLDMNKDVYKWTYAYENGKMSNNLLVYRKIYFNQQNTESKFVEAVDTVCGTQNPPNTQQNNVSKEALRQITKKKKISPSDLRRREKRRAMFGDHTGPPLCKPVEKQVSNETITANNQESKTEVKTPSSESGNTKLKKTKLKILLAEMKQDQLKPQYSSPSNTRSVNIEPRSCNNLKVTVTNDCFVAVMTEPFTELTHNQVQSIIKTLELHIEALISCEHEVYWPSFRGKPFYSDGVLKLHCEGQKDVEWLKDAVDSILSPVPGTVLVVKRQTEIPKLVKSAVMLPNCFEDINFIKQILIKQNNCYDVSKWSFYDIKHNEKSDSLLELGIPVEQIPLVLACGRKVCYKLGNTCIRFFDSAGRLQDMPVTEKALVTPPSLLTRQDPTSDQANAFIYKLDRKA